MLHKKSCSIAACRQTSLLMEKVNIFGDGRCGLEAGAVQERVCFYLAIQGV